LEVFTYLAYASTKALRVALGATLAALATVALVAASPLARLADLVLTTSISPSHRRSLDHALGL
jgi:hypothetical protein